MGGGEKYVSLLKNIKKSLDNKFLCQDHYASEYELICRTLGDILGNANHFEDGIAIEVDGIRIALRNGMESILSTILYDYGWNMEHLWKDGKYKKETSLQYMKACYYLNMFYGRLKDREFVKKHIQKIYGLELI